MSQQHVLNLQQQLINLQSSFYNQNQALEKISSNQQQISINIASINNRQEQLLNIVDKLTKSVQQDTTTIEPDFINVNNNANTNAVMVTVHNHTIIHPNNTNDNLVPNSSNITRNTEPIPKPRINGLLAITANPRYVPPMTTKFPPSWLQLLEEWEREKLSAFAGYGFRSHFSVAEKSRYSKRQRGILQLTRVSKDRKQTIRLTAEQLDIERETRRRTKSSYNINDQLTEYESADPTIRRRQMN